MGNGSVGKVPAVWAWSPSVCPQHPHQTLGTVACIYNPTWLFWGGRDRRNLRACSPANLANMASCRFTKILTQKIGWSASKMARWVKVPAVPAWPGEFEPQNPRKCGRRVTTKLSSDFQTCSMTCTTFIQIITFQVNTKWRAMEENHLSLRHPCMHTWSTQKASRLKLLTL